MSAASSLSILTIKASFLPHLARSMFTVRISNWAALFQSTGTQPVRDLTNEVFTAGSTSFTVTAADGAASLSGGDVSLKTEVADLVFNFSIALTTSASTGAGLTITINGGSLVFSDSPRTNVAITAVDGALDVSENGDFAVSLAGTLDADLVGFDVSNAAVEVSYELIEGTRQFKVNTTDQVVIAVQSNAGSAKVSFVADAALERWS